MLASNTPSVRHDAYARIPFDSERVVASDLHAGGITFLDLPRSERPLETIAGYTDAIPAWLLARPSAVLMRWQEDGDAQVAADRFRVRFEARGVSVPVGLVTFPIGCDPAITWDARAQTQRDAAGLNDDLELLHRARRAELDAYLSWGGAVWRPTGYHYQFPSGRHSRVYIRLADAFMDVRAAPAIATWLYRHIQPEATTAVVVDSGTMGPVITELRAAAERTRGSVGPVIGIDAYPPSALGLQQRLRKLTDGVHVLGIVSVSDTGTLANQLSSVLNSPASGTLDVVVEQLVARGLPEATDIAVLPGSVTDPWLSLGIPGGAPSDPPCEACRDPQAARVVRIDPRSMSAMLLPEPTLLMPDLTDARRNASLWETYEKAVAGRQWTGLTGPTGTRRSPDNTQDSDRASVFFEPATLMTQQGAVRTRTKDFDRLPARRADDPGKDRVLAARSAVGDASRVVIVDDVERGLFASAGEWVAVKEELGPFVATDASYFQYTAGDGRGHIEPVDGGAEPQEPASVLVVALGMRTGVTLHRMFLAARERWPFAEHRGLVVHAHPNDDRIWASARNTFTDSSGVPRLVALWLTYMPRWSPFSDELELLRSVPEGDITHGAAKELLRERQRELELPGGPSVPFWGPADLHLRAGSFFGDSLGAAATAAAVGSALQAARLQARPVGGPHWAMIDLPRTLRSFFDGLIHVAVLRWSRPEECWWGDRPRDCTQLIHELRHQMRVDWPLLLPELLLAGLQGKLPREDFQEVVTLAETAVRSSTNLEGIADERARAFLQLGLELARIAPRVERPVERG